MAIVIDGRRKILGDVRAEIVRLEELLIDLKHIDAGHMPESRNVLFAPLIHDWRIVPWPTATLTGTVAGHPSVVDGRPAVTSAITVFAPELGWARTGSRLYRLGDRRPQ